MKWREESSDYVVWTTWEDTHYQNVIWLYTVGHEYISQLPNFHIGFDMATEKLFNLLSKHSEIVYKNILELCCGNWWTTKRLVEEFECFVTWIDITPVQIESIRQWAIENWLTHKLQLLCDNVESMNTDYFLWIDIILSEDAFSHFRDTKWFIQNMNSFLETWTILAFSDLIRTNDLKKSEQQRQETNRCLYDILTTELYKEILTENGFEILECEDHTAAELTRYHLKMQEKILWDKSYERYKKYFSNDEIYNWLKEAEKVLYDQKKERFITFELLLALKLDYIFVVARKL